MNNCANKLGNLEEIGNFFERHKQLKLTQEEVENMNAHIKIKKLH